MRIHTYVRAHKYTNKQQTHSAHDVYTHKHTGDGLKIHCCVLGCAHLVGGLDNQTHHLVGGEREVNAPIATRLLCAHVSIR